MTEQSSKEEVLLRMRELEASPLIQPLSIMQDCSGTLRNKQLKENKR